MTTPVIYKKFLIYVLSCSMGNKQGQLEAAVQHENYDIVPIMETG